MRRTGNGRWNWPIFLVLVAVQIWAAHLVAFFMHEYAHAFTAWILGWKANPLDLHFPPVTPVVLAIQLGIDQNVDELAILAAGHGMQAGVIGLAGVVVGNALISYPLSRLLYRRARAVGSRGWAMFAFWLTIASIGNLIDYVPIRTFTLEGDMGLVQRGFGWSPWVLLVVLGIPTFIVLVHFLVRIVPDTLDWLFPDDAGKRCLSACLAVAALFGFYGMVGLLEGGPYAYRMSMISVGIVLPVVSVVGILFLRRDRVAQPSPASGA